MPAATVASGEAAILAAVSGGILPPGREAALAQQMAIRRRQADVAGQERLFVVRLRHGQGTASLERFGQAAARVRGPMRHDDHRHWEVRRQRSQQGGQGPQ
jgi:hypothetical protein